MVLTTPPSSVQTSIFLGILPKIHIAMEVVAVYLRQDMNSNHVHTKLPSTTAQPSPNRSDVYQHKQMYTHTHTQTDQLLGSLHQQNRPCRQAHTPQFIPFWGRIHTWVIKNLCQTNRFSTLLETYFLVRYKYKNSCLCTLKQTGKRVFKYLSSSTILRAARAFINSWLLANNETLEHKASLQNSYIVQLYERFFTTYTNCSLNVQHG